MKVLNLHIATLEQMIFDEAEIIEIRGMQYNELELLRDHDQTAYRTVIADEINSLVERGEIIESLGSESGYARVIQ